MTENVEKSKDVNLVLANYLKEDVNKPLIFQRIDGNKR